MSRKLIRIAIVAGALAFSGAAFAKGAAPVQNHHCRMPDGTVDAARTHKQCTAAKGAWVKDSAKSAAPKDAPAK